jgi:hypothetical protein
MEGSRSQGCRMTPEPTNIPPKAPARRTKTENGRPVLKGTQPIFEALYAFWLTAGESAKKAEKLTIEMMRALAGIVLVLPTREQLE